jgi:hypothetical protein
MRKGQSHPILRRDYTVTKAVTNLSKAALADLVADAMDSIYGEEAWSADEFAEWANPRLRVRGDTLVRG